MAARAAGAAPLNVDGDASMNDLARATSSGFPAKRWLPLAVLAGGLVLFFALGGQRYLSFGTLRQHHEELHHFVADNALAAGLCFVLAYALITAFSLPGGAVMTVFGGYVFGPYLAACYVVIAATGGATVLFLAARSTLGAVLRARAGPFLQKMEAGFQENALSYLLVLRLVPLFPFWLVNLVPAFLGVPLRTYVIGTLLGIIPGTFVYASLGGGIDEVLDTGREPDFDIIFHANVLLPIIGLALLALLPVVYKRLKARKR